MVRLPAAALLSAALALPSQACLSDAMIVLDASVSMARPVAGGGTRMEEAREGLASALPRIAAARRVGLVVFGPGGRHSCDGIATRFPPRADAAPAVSAAARATLPEGATPLVASVEEALRHLAWRTEPADVVLVTDGNETCGRSPCAFATELAAEAPALRVHVIGFHYARHLFSENASGPYDFDVVAKCLADRTGGTFVDARAPDALAHALLRVLGCTIG